MEPERKTYWITKYLFTCGIEQKKLGVSSDPDYVRQLHRRRYERRSWFRLDSRRSTCLAGPVAYVCRWSRSASSECRVSAKRTHGRKDTGSIGSEGSRKRAQMVRLGVLMLADGLRRFGANSMGRGHKTHGYGEVVFDGSDPPKKRKEP